MRSIHSLDPSCVCVFSLLSFNCLATSISGYNTSPSLPSNPNSRLQRKRCEHNQPMERQQEQNADMILSLHSPNISATDKLVSPTDIYLFQIQPSSLPHSNSLPAPCSAPAHKFRSHAQNEEERRGRRRQIRGGGAYSPHYSISGLLISFLSMKTAGTLDLRHCELLMGFGCGCTCLLGGERK